LIIMANTSFPGLSSPMRANQRRVPDTAAATATPTPRLPVAAPIGGEQPASTPIGTANQRIQDALTAFERAWGDIAAAEQRGELTPEGRSAMVADAAAPVIDAIDQATAAAADRVDAADREYRRVRAALAPRPGTELDALNHGQWWSRVVRELDATPQEKVIQAARRVVENADGPELHWAAAELGSYLKSRAVPNDWLDGVLEQASPKLKVASETRRKAEQSRAVVVSNGTSARHAMANALHGSYRRPVGLVDVSAFDPDA
jgi:hypothetical protein